MSGFSARCAAVSGSHKQRRGMVSRHILARNRRPARAVYARRAITSAAGSPASETPASPLDRGFFCGDGSGCYPVIEAIKDRSSAYINLDALCSAAWARQTRARLEHPHPD